MSIEILVAIVASITSLIVAIFGLISSIISSRQSAISAKEIEHLKLEIRNSISLNENKDKILIEIINSLDKSIESIQFIKDNIQLIISSIDESLDSDLAIKYLSSSRENIFSVYREYLYNLDEFDSKAIHDAKNLSLKIERFVENCLKGKTYASSLSEAEKQKLILFRHELTDLQYQIRDTRMQKIILRIGDKI